MKEKWSVLNLDFLGKKPSLFVNNQIRYQTVYGSCVTLVIFAALLSVILYFFVDFILGTGMTIIYSKGTLMGDHAYTLNQRVFMFQILFPNGTMIDPRIASFSIVSVHNVKNTFDYTSIPLENCKFDVHFPRQENEGLLSKYVVNDFYCLSPNYNVTLKEEPANLTSDYINIFVHRCTNSTENNNHCESIENINTILKTSSIYFSFIYEDTQINHFNPDNPFEKNIHDINKIISWTFVYDYILYWKKVDYRSDRGFFFSMWKDFLDYQYDLYSEEVTIHSDPERYIIPNSYAKLKIGIFEKGTDHYQRVYPKIQGVIANVSGIMTVVLHLGQVLINMLTSGIYYNQLFTVSHKKDINHCNSNSFYFSHSRSQSLNYNSNNKLSIQLTRLKSRSLNQFFPSHTRTEKVNTSNSLQWKIMPSCNKKTVYLTQCKREIARMFSIENIINKLLLIELEAKPSVKTLLNTSLQEGKMMKSHITKTNNNNNGNNTNTLANTINNKRSLCNNFITPHGSFISLKKEDLEG